MVFSGLSPNYSAFKNPDFIQIFFRTTYQFHQFRFIKSNSHTKISFINIFYTYTIYYTIFGHADLTHLHLKEVVDRLLQSWYTSMYFATLDAHLTCYWLRRKYQFGHKNGILMQINKVEKKLAPAHQHLFTGIGSPAHLHLLTWTWSYSPACSSAYSPSSSPACCLKRHMLNLFKKYFAF